MEESYRAGKLDANQEETPKGSSSHVKSTDKQSKSGRSFDFTRYNQRHIALKIAYLGWDYRGFVSQENTENTIEEHLFSALDKLCLIKDRLSCRYSRCGRTDKGVSALGQVIAVAVRSNLLDGPGVFCPEGGKAQDRPGDKTTELNYVYLLNRVLPEDIRVLAWCPVSSHFNARFDCLCRTYKYFFPRGSLNIDIMRSAAEKFVGEHDFRNFCKMDVNGGVTNFRRRILSFQIDCLGDDSPYQMCVMTITGQAFLWHQVRCMAAILLLISQGLEQSEVFKHEAMLHGDSVKLWIAVLDHMLDISRCPGKPQYTMASEYPLLLYDCAFEEVKWVNQTADSHQHVVEHFQSLWSSQMIRSALLDTMLKEVTCQLVTEEMGQADPKDVNSQTEMLIPGFRRKRHRPILTRPTADTLEERLAKRQKVERSKEASVKKNMKYLANWTNNRNDKSDSPPMT